MRQHVGWRMVCRVLATAAVIAAVGCGDGATELTPTFRGLGFLNTQPDASTHAYGMSQDGRVVVGDGISDVSLEAFQWSADGGLRALGFAPDKVQSQALSANRDGSVIVGNSNGFRGLDQVASRWTATSGWQLLEGDGFFPLRARAVSADGNTIVGESQLEGSPNQEGFLWTPSGSRLLGSLGAGLPSLASGVSADGTVVSGIAQKEDQKNVAFRWTDADGLVVLPLLAGAEACDAQDISADGGTIVGNCQTDGLPQAVLWDRRGAVGLGFLPGGEGSLLQDVSGDGSVAVGQAGGPEGFARAALWTRANGVQDLREVLIGLGLQKEVEGWFLDTANAISSDGHVITGYGKDPNGNSQAFVVTLPVLPP